MKSPSAHASRRAASEAGNVQVTVLLGVRKSAAITPRSGVGGNVSGTPITIEWRPLRDRWCQNGRAFTCVPFTMKLSSYSWDARFLKP